MDPTRRRAFVTVNADVWSSSANNIFSPPKILPDSQFLPQSPLNWPSPPVSPPGTGSATGTDAGTMSDASLHASAPQTHVPHAGPPPVAAVTNATTSTPASNASAPNPRSCVTCRRRKVKCDKKQPCSNCVRAKIECIFPGPGRAPRKSRKPPDTELMERLRRLEGVVQSLNAQVEEHEHEAAERDRNEQSRKPSMDEMCKQKDDTSPNTLSPGADASVEALESRFGRLVVDQGRSRYINNSFWASLNNEVEDLRSILIEPSDDEDDCQSPQSSDNSSQHQSFIFGYSSTNVDMLSLHPTPERAREYWEIYKVNVDPLVKVLHLPSFEPVLLDAMCHPEKVPKGLEALMFAIYYGGVTSTMQDECMKMWGEQRQILLQKLRFALEQALARANFLYCDEIVVLQAFVIFLIVLRRNEDARKIWTLTGLVVRNAQTLGIHRDGSHFDLPPFQIEMRRRLWWQVCILDARSSEDHGCDPTIIEAQFDTKMPLNVNDSELWPDMKELPEEHIGFTDITFCLIRMEVANIFRRILHVPPGPVRCNEFFANLTIEQKEKWISESHQRLEEKYLKDCDMSDPMCWVAATISRLIMSKMWLIVYHPYQRKDGGASLPQETKDKLFITSLENVEYSMLLETEARTMKWGWLFRTYVQWHAIAFLLSELCVRTKGEAVDRAWRALESTAGRWLYQLSDDSAANRNKGCLWRPLRKLMAKARAARARELAVQRANVAFRNQNPAYQDMSLTLDHMSAISAVDKPTADVDKMLSPSPPRVGEKLRTSLPDLPSEPAFGRTPTSPNGSIVAVNPSSNNAGVNFENLTNYGIDYVINDVMEDMTYEGPLNNYATQNPILASPLNGHFSPPSLNTSSITNGGTIIGPTTAQTRTFPSSIWEDLMGDSGGDSSGPNSTSPVLDGANMDWASWDDLVSQYGREDMTAQYPIDTQNTHANMNGTNGNSNVNGNVNSTPQGHLGMVHWF